LLHFNAAPGTVPGFGADPRNGEVALSWSDPLDDGGSQISYYVVQVFNSKKGNSALQTVEVTDLAENLVTITGLTNGINYYFNIAAANDAGVGSYLANRVSATPAFNFASTVTPTISGTTTVGQTLTATTGTWSPQPKFAFQWLRNGVAISRATKATYRLTSADLGSTIRVRVTGTLKNYLTTTVTSSPTANIE
jgi:hypothetical protein